MRQVNDPAMLSTWAARHLFVGAIFVVALFLGRQEACPYVIPVEAGIQAFRISWTSASAGMTGALKPATVFMK